MFPSPTQANLGSVRSRVRLRNNEEALLTCSLRRLKFTDLPRVFLGAAMAFSLLLFSLSGVLLLKSALQPCIPFTPKDNKFSHTEPLLKFCRVAT